MLSANPYNIEGNPLVYLMGLSAKPNCSHLAPETNTGSIIEQIIYRLPSIKFVKTNLVRTPPLDQSGKLRFPNLSEMKLGWNELQVEINQTIPNLLVALGQQVSIFLRTEMGLLPTKAQFPSDFSSEKYLSQSKSCILSVHHPSFVFVYRRKDINNYVENVASAISYLIYESENYPNKWGEKVN